VPYAIEINQASKNEYLIIEGDKIIQRTDKQPFLNISKMNVDGCFIQPGLAFYEPEFGQFYKNLQERKHKFKRLIEQGATLVVTTFFVDDPSNLKTCLSKARHLMINSPIDFVLGATVDIKHLTPRLVLKLSKEKIPFIVFRFSHWDDVYATAWEWIRDSIFGSGPLLIPDWRPERNEHRTIKKRYNDWYAYAKWLNLPVLAPIKPHEPLSKGQLKALGIYPIKGVFHPGADCDYVLCPALLDGSLPNRYDKNKPSVVVIRGKIQLADQMIYRPGFGLEVKIRMPKRFTDYWECINDDG